ncbi:MAG: tRNA (adenosine(37)-N6)-threonylcarbamoyltransferase complex ATPase subunit type 1 TsaE [Candidatus Pacebacteria bacterium]|nr:tRNA (adenosine(37)-N6)-threonylcarbamoyltransferase complex ATPase subunit type 1 TsaE [Candidatus Paceibacterota bacterium]
MSNKLITTSSKETQKLGQLMAQEILKLGPNQQGAFLIALRGDLGSGKTTFTQGLAKGFGIHEKITSPTFVIMKRFAIHHLLFQNFYHVDCYRIERSEDILDLGWRDISASPYNIVAVEWPERIKKLLPAEMFNMDFKFLDNQKRSIYLSRA